MYHVVVALDLGQGKYWIMLDMVVKFAKEMQRKLKLVISNHAQVSNLLEVKNIIWNQEYKDFSCLKHIYDNI